MMTRDLIRPTTSHIGPMRELVRPLVLAGLLWLAFTSACVLAWAQAPRTLSFQAHLTSKSGQAINNPALPVTIVLYDAPQNGAALYTESQTAAVSSGRLSLILGTGNVGAFAALPFDKPYWVGIKLGNDPEMTPRLPLAAAPYARSASSVADGSVRSRHLAYDSASLARVSSDMVRTALGGIEIRPPDPAYGLDVNGTVRIRDRWALELGTGVAGKEQNAGKIGYQTFTTDALDIVGAGTSGANRRIKFHNEGGAAFSGPVGIRADVPQASLHVAGNGDVMILEGWDHAYMQFFPRGMWNGRKGYIGFPSAGSRDLEIANEDGGAVRVWGTFVNNSDARYKTAIAPLRNALDTVLRLRGVSYDWRTDLPGVQMPAQRQIGFVAQDVEKVLPDLVYTDAKGDKSVAYVNVVPVLVEAVKQQQGLLEEKDARLAAQAGRIRDLERESRRMEARLRRLEQMMGTR